MGPTHLQLLTILNFVYPEPVDEVIAGQQVVDQKFESVVSGGLVEGKNIKRPLIHLLENSYHRIVNVTSGMGSKSVKAADRAERFKSFTVIRPFLH